MICEFWQDLYNFSIMISSQVELDYPNDLLKFHGKQ